MSGPATQRLRATPHPLRSSSSQGLLQQVARDPYLQLCLPVRRFLDPNHYAADYVGDALKGVHMFFRSEPSWEIIEVLYGMGWRMRKSQVIVECVGSGTWLSLCLSPAGEPRALCRSLSRVLLSGLATVSTQLAWQAWPHLGSPRPLPQQQGIHLTGCHGLAAHGLGELLVALQRRGTQG